MLWGFTSCRKMAEKQDPLKAQFVRCFSRREFLLGCVLDPNRACPPTTCKPLVGSTPPEAATLNP